MRPIVLFGIIAAGLVNAGDAQERLKESEVAVPDSSVAERRPDQNLETLPAPTAIDEILNFHQMTDNIATGGQPTEGELSHIADAGYSVVVNLAMHDSDNAIPEEGSIIASLGMSYVHIPVPSDAPTSDHVRSFFRVMDSFDGEKVFVHCTSSGRVSAFMHRYMMLRKGASPEEATSPLLQRWRPRMDERWQSILELELADIEE